MKIFFELLMCIVLVTACSTNTKMQDTHSVELTEKTELLDSAEALAKLKVSIQTGDSVLFSTIINYIGSLDTLCYSDKDMIYSPVGYACKHGKADILQQLISNNVDINIGCEDDYFAYDALYVSIDNDFEEGVKILLKSGANQNAIYTENGITPLVLSCIRNNFTIAQILIKAGANINDGVDMGFDYIHYPIIEATRANNLKLVKLLVECGADINVKDKQGESSVSIARDNDYIEITDYINSFEKELDEANLTF